MLVLGRKENEKIIIGSDIEVTLIEIEGQQVKLGIEAPSDVDIYREEIYSRIVEENKKAAKNKDIDIVGLSRFKSKKGEKNREKGLNP